MSHERKACPMKLQEVRDLIRFQPLVGDKTERVLRDA